MSAEHLHDIPSECAETSQASSSDPHPTKKLERRLEERESQRVEGNLRSQRARNWTERLLTRSMTGAIYALCVFVCLLWGQVPTMVLIAAMSWLCCSEFYRIVRMSGRMPNEFIGLTATVLYPAGALISIESSQALTFIFILLVGTWYVLTPRAGIGDAAVTVFGALYTGFLFSSIVTIRASNPDFDGALLSLGVMASVWINDAFAFFVGSRFGAHKLAPRISPNKSWEGVLGGIVGSCLIWFVLVFLGVYNLPAVLALIAGVLCGIAASIGDLFESRLKRAVGVKDSGNLMPGHGGLLDRSDSMLFACMTAYFVLHIGGFL